MASDPDGKAGRIAARQLGLITYRQARHRAGLTDRQIRHRVATKRWRQVQIDVYAVEGAAGSWERSALAAQRRARTETLATSHGRTRLVEVDDAALTGASAVWNRGVRRLGKPEEHQLLVGRARVPAVKGAEVTRTRDLPATDVEKVNGIPTLRVPRLAAELCRTLKDTDFVAVLDELLWNANERARAEVHDRAVALRNGRGRLDRLIELTAPDAAERFRSWLERHTSGVWTPAGLVPDAWNLLIRDADGAVIGECDAVWLREKVVVELDGLRFHAAPGQARRDRRKDRRLQTAEWVVLRYTWLDVVERPDEVIAEIAAALANRR